MSYHAEARRIVPRGYRELSEKPNAAPRAGYILAISGALAAVTFTLVYLTTFSYVGGF